MNRRWLCNDVWLDILPSFDRPQLGLKMALLSDRFDILVDKHFDGKKELTLWNDIRIVKDEGLESTLSLMIDGKWVAFSFPDRPLPTKIRFKKLRIKYIDYSVIEFLHANKHIWDRMGTDLEWFCENAQPIWDILDRQIWPIFTTNIRELYFPGGAYLDNLRRHTSPTILTDLDQLISIDTDDLFPDVIADDGPNATARQALSKWLHTPSKNGQPKRLSCEDLEEEGNIDWVNSFKEAFARATNSSVSYRIKFAVYKTSIEPFESVNERTKEKLTLLALGESVDEDSGVEYIKWLLMRCPISEKAAPIQLKNDKNRDDNLNSIRFEFSGDINKFIGPLSPPAAEEEKEKADESNEK